MSIAVPGLPPRMRGRPGSEKEEKEENIVAAFPVRSSSLKQSIELNTEIAGSEIIENRLIYVCFSSSIVVKILSADLQRLEVGAPGGLDVQCWNRMIEDLK